MTIINMAGGGGNNINVPLNGISDLTATSGAGQAVIKRTDVGDLVVNGVTVNEWSCTKLVRKTGSAPASSNDGTPVLTETLENAYSVTGYTDTGLTSGTTYYYGAFSVGTNGLETISNIATVTPGWQPGANTIFYYNIDGTDDNSTLYDKSGNGYDLTWNKTPTYATDATYGRVVQSTGASTAVAYRNYIDLGTTQTCNILINVTGNSGWDLVLLSGATGLQLSDLDWFLGIGPTYIDLRNESQNKRISTTNSGWKLITITRDTNGVVFYKNGTQIGTMSYTAVTYNNYLQLFNSKSTNDVGGTSYIKMVMMEDKVWTQQEIQGLATEYGLI